MSTSPMPTAPCTRPGARRAATALLIVATLGSAVAQTPPPPGKDVKAIEMWGDQVTVKLGNGMKNLPSLQMRAVLQQITDALNFPNVFGELHRVGDEDYAGAFAGRTASNKPAIFYGSKFEQKFSQADNWDAIIVLAHEWKHLVSRDADNPPTREMELKADRFAGCVVGVMGGKRADAVGLYERMASLEEKGTHPGRKERIKWVVEGWDAGFRPRGPGPCFHLRPVP